jgi:hypothetical protein
MPATYWEYDLGGRTDGAILLDMRLFSNLNGYGDASLILSLDKLLNQTNTYVPYSVLTSVGMINGSPAGIDLEIGIESDGILRIFVDGANFNNANIWIGSAKIS